MAELRCIFKILMATELLARVAVKTNMVEEIIALKNAMVLQHEIISVRDKRFQNRCAQFGMVKSAKQIANVVQERANHIFIIAAIFNGACRGLEAVFKTVNGKATMVALEHF